jgi:hypothetical protein
MLGVHMLSVNMLSVHVLRDVMLSVNMLSAVILNVMATKRANLLPASLVPR